jgi:hypothetical protein
VITQAALDVLGTNDALVLRLGAQTPRLTNYAWMGDYFGVIMEEPGELFYADDYLLFPGAPKYYDHTGPEVRQTFRPFFQRALQALQTENNANAARWVGALLHFVQDAGCPPHAAGLRGDVHSKMETWVDNDQIRIPNYQTRPMGTTEDEVYTELLRRLDRLIIDAEDRGRRLRVPVEIGNRTPVRPLVLESATDCARLTADLLHAIGPLAQNVPNSGTLRGTITSQPGAGMERFPAKVVLQGTSFSTLADLSGRFEFRNLPAGNYTVAAFRPGNGTARKEIKLKAGEAAACELALPTDSKNLFCNGDFKLAWVRPTGPDYWSQTRNGWESEPILLQKGQTYRISAHFKEGASGNIVVRWLHSFEHAVPRYKIEPKFKTRALTPADREMTLTGGVDCGLVHLTIRGRTPPASILESIRVEAVTK